MNLAPDRPPDEYYRCAECEGWVEVWYYNSKHTGHRIRFTRDTICMRMSVIDMNAVVKILG
jgi:hypothetical protein